MSIEKDELSRQIEAIENEIQKLNKQKMELETKNAELHKKSREIEIEEATESTLKLVHKVDEWNSMEIYLYQNSKTTPIFDDFYQSDCDYLIIKNFITIDSMKGFEVPFSLIVIKNSMLQGTVHVKKTGLTISDLKITNSLRPKEANRRMRLAALADEIDEISELDISCCYEGECIPFSNICVLGAQIYRNQRGYGTIYCGEELVHQGTLYGETTSFYIIGVRCEADCF